MPTKSTNFLVISHILTALIAIIGSFTWFMLWKGSNMKSDVRYKIALISAENISGHQSSREGFLRGFSRVTEFTENCRVHNYYACSLDQLVAKQICLTVLKDNPDAIVVVGTSLTQTIVHLARAKSISIPIVFIGVSNAVDLGLVDSLESSGNNVTGVSTVNEDVSTPLELLKFLKPSVKSILLPYYAGSTVGERDAVKVQKYAQGCGVTVELLPVSALGDVLKLVAGRIAYHDTVMYLEGDMVNSAYDGFVRLCNRHGKTFFPLECEAAKGGAVFSYGVTPGLTGEVAAQYVKKILLDHLRPTDLPVSLLQNSRRFIVNYEAAAQQDVKISSAILRVIDKVSLFHESSLR